LVPMIDLESSRFKELWRRRRRRRNFFNKFWIPFGEFELNLSFFVGLVICRS
jgi:hypothetical protein